MSCYIGNYSLHQSRQSTRHVTQIKWIALRRHERERASRYAYITARQAAVAVACSGTELSRLRLARRSPPRALLRRVVSQCGYFRKVRFLNRVFSDVEYGLGRLGGGDIGSKTLLTLLVQCEEHSDGLHTSSDGA